MMDEYKVIRGSIEGQEKYCRIPIRRKRKTDAEIRKAIETLKLTEVAEVEGEAEIVAEAKAEIKKDIGTAISAMQELQQYRELEEKCIKENSFCLRMLMHKWQEFTGDIAELYQYRQIGTVEDVTKRENDIRTLSGMFERLSDKEVAEYHELQEYQTIGTPEECRVAKENQKKYIELAIKEYMCELYEKQITELSQTVQHWANEARMQTAAAGELKIALVEKLEETRWRKEVVGGLITEARSDMDRLVLDWKLMQFEEQEKWLVEMLEKGRQAAGQEEK